MAVSLEAIKGLGVGEKLALGGSVYARGNADGSVSFTLNRKVGGKTATATLGRYEAIDKGTLREVQKLALKTREEKPKAVAAPTPGTRGKLHAKSTLGEVWDDFLAAVDRGGKWQPRHRKTSVDRVNKYLQPSDLWNRPIVGIDAADIKDLLEPVRASVPQQADKIRSLLSLVFAHAANHRIIAISPVPQAGAMLRATTKQAKAKNFPTFTDWSKLRGVYTAIINSNLDASVRNCLRLQALTMTRSGEVIQARWDQFDLESGRWVLPREVMKVKDETRGDHVLYLSRQTIEWLRTLSNDGEFLFPGAKGNDTISLDAPAKALRSTLKYAGQFVPHSWRAACSTLAKRAVGPDGRPMFHRAWVEQLLDHEIGENEVEAAYDRGQHYKEAGLVLQWWSDSLAGN